MAWISTHNNVVSYHRLRRVVGVGASRDDSVMITDFDMWKAPAGNWVILIRHTDPNWNRLWYDYDYDTPEEGAKRLTQMVESRLHR